MFVAAVGNILPHENLQGRSTQVGQAPHSQFTEVPTILSVVDAALLIVCQRVCPSNINLVSFNSIKTFAGNLTGAGTLAYIVEQQST